MYLDSIAKDPEFDDIVVVRDINGAEIRYRLGDDGVLRPGRVWSCYRPGIDYKVALFIPLPDGPPELLTVEAC